MLELIQYSVLKKLDGQPVVTGPPFDNSTSLSTFFVTLVVSIMKFRNGLSVHMIVKQAIPSSIL